MSLVFSQISETLAYPLSSLLLCNLYLLQKAGLCPNKAIMSKLSIPDSLAFVQKEQRAVCLYHLVFRKVLFT